MSYFCLYCRESKRTLLRKEINSNLVFCRGGCQKSWYNVNAKTSLTEVTEVDAYIYLYLSPMDLISVYKTNETAKELISSVWFMKLYLQTWLKKLNEFGKPDIWQYRKMLINSCGWNTPTHLGYIYHLFQVGVDDFDMKLLDKILKVDPSFIPINLDYVQSVVTRLVKDENMKLFQQFLSRVSPKIISRLEIEEEENLTPIKLEMMDMLRRMQD